MDSKSPKYNLLHHNTIRRNLQFIANPKHDNNKCTTFEEIHMPENNKIQFFKNSRFITDILSSTKKSNLENNNIQVKKNEQTKVNQNNIGIEPKENITNTPIKYDLSKRLDFENNRASVDSYFLSLPINSLSRNQSQNGVKNSTDRPNKSPANLNTTIPKLDIRRLTNGSILSSLKSGEFHSKEFTKEQIQSARVLLEKDKLISALNRPPSKNDISHLFSPKEQKARSALKIHKGGPYNVIDDNKITLNEKNIKMQGTILINESSDHALLSHRNSDAFMNKDIINTTSKSPKEIKIIDHKLKLSKISNIEIRDSISYFGAEKYKPTNDLKFNLDYDAKIIDLDPETIDSGIGVLTENQKSAKNLDNEKNSLPLSFSDAIKKTKFSENLINIEERGETDSSHHNILINLLIPRIIDPGNSQDELYKTILKSEDYLQMKKEIPTLFSHMQASRHDLIIMSNYVDNKIRNLNKEKNCIGLEEKTKRIDELYNIVINELIRQVGIDCYERGKLFYRILSNYMIYFKYFKDTIDEKVIEVRDLATQEYNRKTSTFKDILGEKDRHIENLNNKINELKLQYRDLEIERDKILKNDSQRAKKINKYKKYIIFCKEQMASLKKENELAYSKIQNIAVTSLFNQQNFGIKSPSAKFNELSNALSDDISKLHKPKFENLNIDIHKHLSLVKTMHLDESSHTSDHEASENESELSFELELEKEKTSEEKEVINMDDLNEIKHQIVDFRNGYCDKFTQFDEAVDTKISIETQTELCLINPIYDEVLCNIVEFEELVLEYKFLKENRIKHELLEANEAEIVLLSKKDNILPNDQEKSIMKDGSDAQNLLFKQKEVDYLPEKENNPVIQNTSKAEGFSDNLLFQLPDSKDACQLEDDQISNSVLSITEELVKKKKRLWRTDNKKNGEPGSEKELDLKNMPEQTNECLNSSYYTNNMLNNNNAISISSKTLLNIPNNLTNKLQDGLYIKKTINILLHGNFKEDDRNAYFLNFFNLKENTRNSCKYLNHIMNNPKLSERKTFLLRILFYYKTELQKVSYLHDLVENMKRDIEDKDKEISQLKAINENLYQSINEAEKRIKKCPFCENEDNKISEEGEGEEEFSDNLQINTNQQKNLQIQQKANNEEGIISAVDSINSNLKSGKLLASKQRSIMFGKMLTKHKSTILVNQSMELGKKIPSEKKENPTPNIIEKLKNKKMAKFKNFMPLKLILKLIAQAYEERMNLNRDNLIDKDQEFSGFIFHLFLQQFGFRKIAEQKLIIFLMSLKKYLHIIRINLFARFIGLLESKTNYTLDEFNKFIEGMDYLRSSNLGTTILNCETDTKHYTPYVRFLDYVKYFSDGKLSYDELQEFKKEFEALKENDPKNINRLGIIDIDIAFMKILNKYRLIYNRTKSYVVNAFLASDFDRNKVCSEEEFLMMYKYIEPEKYDEDFAKGVFRDNQDIEWKGQPALSFDKFSIVCVEYSLFSNEQQDKFLGVITKAQIVNKLLDLKSKWNTISIQTEQMVKNLNNAPETKKNFVLDFLRKLTKRITISIIKEEEYKPILIAYEMLKKELEDLKEADALPSSYQRYLLLFSYDCQYW